MSKQGIGTISVQGGYRPQNGEPREVPIVQSTVSGKKNRGYSASSSLSILML